MNRSVKVLLRTFMVIILLVTMKTSDVLSARQLSGW
jgi:hypothetical protein